MLEKKKIILRRILPVLLILALVPTFMAVPAAAAPSTPRVHYNLFEGVTHFSFYKGGQLYTDSLMSPTEYSDGYNDVSFAWPNPFDVQYKEIYITVFSYKKPSSVTAYYSNNKTIEMVYLGAYGHYRQYRASIDSTVSRMRFDISFSAKYTGSIFISSASGFRDSSYMLDNITAEVSGLFYYAPTATLHETYLAKKIGSSFDLYGTQSDANGELIQTQVELTVPSSSLAFDDISSITFLLVIFEGGQYNPDINLQVVTQGTDNPLIIPVDVVTSGSFNNYEIVQNNEVIGVWPVVYYQLTADLSGIDLKNKDIRLNFDLDPVPRSTINNIDVEQWFFALDGAYITLNTEEISWINRIGRWIVDLGDKLKNSVSDLSESVSNAGASEHSAANQQGNSGASQLENAVPDYSAGFVDSVTGLASSMSYDGTAAVLSSGPVVFPAIGNVVPSFTILDSVEVDFETYVNMMPAPVLLLVRSLFTIALIVYCFKELYSTIAYILTLKGGGD